MQVFIYCKITLNVSGVHRTHHQEYIKLELQPLAQVIVSEQQPSSDVSYRMQVFIYCKYTLHVSGVHRTHHQEYINL
jgi:hypothetical protein